MAVTLHGTTNKPVGIATFGPGTTSGVNLSGSFGGGGYPGATPAGGYQNTATTSDQYLGGNIGSTGVLGASTTGGSGGYSGSGIDPTTGLSYDAEEGQVNTQLGQLDNQLGVGNQNILDAYNSSYNKLLGQKGIADRNYNTSKAQTLQDYTGARSNNQAQTGQTANSLQRLLGSHGYQGSANLAAGYAAARQGAVGQQQLEQGFGRNQQALDTNYGDFNNQYNSSVGDLGHQRDVQKNQLQSKVDQTKQGLLGQLAQIATARGGNTSGYTNQINQLGDQITNLGREYASPVLQATPAVYQAPTLESYNAPQQAAPNVNNQVAGAASNVNPFLSVLLGQDKKNLNGFGA